jgi:hypothetical protein
MIQSFGDAHYFAIYRNIISIYLKISSRAAPIIKARRLLIEGHRFKSSFTG